MKIFGWMQNKINGRLGNKKSNPISAIHHAQKGTQKKEFSDWPDGLLAIGTFGNNDIKEEDSKLNFAPENKSQEHLEELTPEEIQKLQNELNLVLHKQDDSTSDTESSNFNLVNGNTSLEDDQDCRNNIVVIGKGKGIFVDNARNAVNKRSLSFLLKKMFACRGGFTPTPSIRDQVPESKIEKILRTLLHKKIYPQNPTSNLSAKKYLENKQKATPDNEDDLNDKVDNGSRWVKTDSEYIVLEI